MKRWYISVLLILPALGVGFYEFISLNRAKASLETMSIEGIISEFRSYNGYTTFKVKGEVFRMQSLVPCIYQRDEIQVTKKLAEAPKCRT